MNLIIVGSIAIDDVKTPFGRREYSLGGAAAYASLAAGKFVNCGIVGVVGDDYPKSAIDTLNSNNVNTDGIEVVKGKTFRWAGVYNDLNQAETLDTQLNVFADFTPKLNQNYLNAEYLFLGNIHPQLQLDVIESVAGTKFISCDTMNFWIYGTPDLLKKVISKVSLLFINEQEIKSFTKKENIYDAADVMMSFGVKYVVVKLGEYGSVLISNDLIFSVPAFPVRCVIDPTGAGDCFAGGFMGYVTKQKNIEKHTLKNAMLYGTVCASVNIQSFSFDAIVETKISDIEIRYNELKNIMSL
jgi:sugar/nucleoside kinase (ribokinase family)